MAEDEEEPTQKGKLEEHELEKDVTATGALEELPAICVASGHRIGILFSHYYPLFSQNLLGVSVTGRFARLPALATMPHPSFL